MPDEPLSSLDGGEGVQAQAPPESGLPLEQQPLQEIQTHGNEAQAEWLKDAAEKMQSE